jgi:hypothetical protein
VQIRCAKEVVFTQELSGQAKHAKETLAPASPIPAHSTHHLANGEDTLAASQKFARLSDGPIATPSSNYIAPSRASSHFDPLCFPIAMGIFSMAFYGSAAVGLVSIFSF